MSREPDPGWVERIVAAVAGLAGPGLAFSLMCDLYPDRAFARDRRVYGSLVTMPGVWMIAGVLAFRPSGLAADRGHVLSVVVGGLAGVTLVVPALYEWAESLGRRPPVISVGVAVLMLGSFVLVPCGMAALGFGLVARHQALKDSADTD